MILGWGKLTETKHKGIKESTNCILRPQGMGEKYHRLKVGLSCILMYIDYEMKSQPGDGALALHSIRPHQALDRRPQSCTLCSP